MVTRSKRKTRSRPKRHRVRSSFRNEVVSLHREIFRRNQARINASVLGYTAAFKRYEREYARAVARYQRKATFSDLNRSLKRAELVYVGDYHTLAQAQRSFLRLMRRLPPERPVTIALEFVQGRHQAALDAYMAGQLSDEEFLVAIQHRAHWVFGGWSGFRDILELARARGWRAIGIDRASRAPGGDSLRPRDRYAARKIAANKKKHPDTLTMVLVGELHVSPSHLPAAVDTAIGQQLERVIIYQNCHEIYFRLEERGQEHDTELVRVSKDAYCLLNTPPIVCQQSFLNWLEADDAAYLTAPEENFKELAKIVADFFKLPLKNAFDRVDVATVVDLSFLQALRRRGDFSESDLREIRKQILRSESYYIPRAEMVYLGNLSVNHAAEEATHFLRHVCSQSHEPRMLVDAFYARCMEEAIAFMGSKVINHKRKCPHADTFDRMSRNRSASPAERQLARLVLRHVRMESGKRVRNMAEIYECSVDAFNAITHVLGYRLGDRLYYALVDGVLSKQEIRKLFFESFEEEGDALTSYLSLIARTKDVVIPERL